MLSDMEQDWLSYSLGKPGAWRDEPWENDVVAKVGDKIFAFFGAASDARPPSVGVKCGSREEADLWLDRFPDAASKMAYIGAHGWNTFLLDGRIPDDDIQELIDHSYELVVAKLPRSRRPPSA